MANQWVGEFLKGTRRPNPFRTLSIPTWDLPTMLRPQCSASFWGDTVCWPSSLDSKDCSATSTSIGKMYGRTAGAISQPLDNRQRGGSRGSNGYSVELVSQGCGFESRLQRELSMTEVRPLSKVPKPNCSPGTAMLQVCSKCSKCVCTWMD